MNLLITCFNQLNNAIYGIAVFFMYCFNKIQQFIIGNTHEEPVRLARVENISWKEKYEAELILGAGIGVIILLFLFAFLVVGQMDPYNNGCLV